MNKEWLTSYKNGISIVVPLEDKKEHNWWETTCPCEPKVEFYKGGIVIIHRSFDFREVWEWLDNHKWSK